VFQSSWRKAREKRIAESLRVVDGLIDNGISAGVEDGFGDGCRDWAYGDSRLLPGRVSCSWGAVGRMSVVVR
jgi:hypothetical protein